MNKFNSQIFLFLFVIGWTLPVWSQEEPNPNPRPGSSEEHATTPTTPEEEEVVNTGVIAGSSRTKKSGIAESLNSGSSPGDEASVVTGGISHEGRDKCIAKLKNASPKNSYSVSFVVEISDNKGGGKTSKYFSATVGPNAEVSRTVSCKPSDNAQVVLKSARKQ